MAPRSTREKIRWNVWKAAERIELSIGNLQHVSELAGERSVDVNLHLPAFIVALETVRQRLLDFREIL